MSPVGAVLIGLSPLVQRPTVPTLDHRSDAQRAAIDRLAHFVVRFGMTVPAIVMLESMRPLSYVGSQWMLVLSPAITSLFALPEWDALSELLEEREGVDVLLDRIEELDRELRQAAR